MTNGRNHRLLKIDTGVGGKGQTRDSAEAIVVPASGLVSVVCVVDSGLDNVVPTDSPSGVLKMYVSGSSNDALPFVPVPKADADLAAISPAGNNVLVNGVASFEATPGVLIKIVYERLSGGGIGSRMRVWVTA